MGRHSLPDPEDSADEPYRSGETDDHHPDSVADDYPDEGHYPPDEDLSADDYSTGEDLYAEDAFEDGTADEYPDFPPRRPGPAASEYRPPRRRCSAAATADSAIGAAVIAARAGAAGSASA